MSMRLRERNRTGDMPEHDGHAATLLADTVPARAAIDHATQPAPFTSAWDKSLSAAAGLGSERWPVCMDGTL
jgi:hypothetical protein